MSFDRACRLLGACDVLEAQELLSGMKIADWPHAKKHERVSLHKKIHKIAYPFEWSNQGPLTLEDAAKKLAGLSVPKKSKGVKRG